VLVLSDADVRSLLDIDRLIERLAAAFIAVSAGAVSVPPRVAATVPERGMLAAMPGYAAGVLETNLVSVFPGNQSRSLPSHQALIVLFDPESGSPVAVLDATWITAARTAASSALATRALARGDASVLAVIGAGAEGRAHLEIVPRGRGFEEIRIASRTRDKAEALAGELGAVAAGSIEEAVRGADVVCLCTSASQPVIDVRWISNGAHVNSIGFSPTGGELDDGTVRASRLVVESRVAFEPPPGGAFELQGMDPSEALELGEVLSGTRKGRTAPDQVTLYKAMGHAAEDAAAAGLVLERARATGAGTSVEL
jgi:ornithine cyclodeaminase/alanine dehydrogenase-like protein (mu-crystallin family)